MLPALPAKALSRNSVLPKRGCICQILSPVNPLCTAISKLEQLILAFVAFLQAMLKREVKPGDVIIKQGERGDHFYVVDEGQFDVLVAKVLLPLVTRLALATLPFPSCLEQLSCFPTPK